MIFALLLIFTSSFIIALSGALMPGPLLTVAISESTRRGAVVGPMMILGHGILELVLILALLAGLGPFLGREDVFVAIALVGGVILMWMAASMFRNLPRLSMEMAVHGETTQNLVRAGIVFSLANPYWLIWWASIGLGYIMQSVQFGFPGVASFFCGHILADLAWYSIVSLGVAKGRNCLGDNAYKRLICCCASFLLLFSCYFFWSGIEKLV